MATGAGRTRGGFPGWPATARVFRCTVGTGLFTPPELAGRSFASVDRTEAHDRFGLAVLIYQFLMGCHPFQIKAPGAEDVCTIEDAIARATVPFPAPEGPSIAMISRFINFTRV